MSLMNSARFEFLNFLWVLIRWKGFRLGSLKALNIDYGLIWAITSNSNTAKSSHLLRKLVSHTFIYFYIILSSKIRT